MSKRIALIDADSIIYAVASTSEICAKRQGTEGEDLWFPCRSLDEAYFLVEHRLQQVVDTISAEDGIVCLSDRNNFRYGIDPTYKGNRVETRRPAYLADLVEALKDRRPFPVMLVKGLEADDVCGISSGQLRAKGREPVICSEDKDLKTIPGLLYQKGEVTEISRPDADRYHLFQTLIGDTTDNYPGAPGVGAVKAEQILKACDHNTPAIRWGWVSGAFTSRGCPYSFALTQARLARILRVEDWDADKREPILWQPPVD